MVLHTTLEHYLVLYSTAQAWISPKAGMDGYGVTDAPADGLAGYRGAACWQVRADPRVPPPSHLKVNLH